MDELNQPYKHLFTPQGDLTAEAVWAYTHGGLNADEMRAAQQHIAGCEICQDAAEGVAAMTDKQQYFDNINALHQNIDQRVEEKKKRVFMWGYQRLAVAALLLLLLGVSVWWFNNKTVTTDTGIAQLDTKPSTPAELNEKKAQDEAVPPQAPVVSGKSDQTISQTIITNGVTSNTVSPVTAEDKNVQTYTIAPSAGTSSEDVTTVEKSGMKGYADSFSVAGNSYNTVSGASAPAPLLEQEDRKSRRKDAKPSAAKTKSAEKAAEGFMADKSVADVDKKELDEESMPADNIEAQYPGSTDKIQRYVDSLRTNKKASRYPVTVRLTLSTTGDVSAVEFIHAPGINAKEKDQLETVLKTLPYWKNTKQRFTRVKKVSVKFNY